MVISVGRNEISENKVTYRIGDLRYLFFEVHLFFQKDSRLAVKKRRQSSVDGRLSLRLPP